MYDLDTIDDEISDLAGVIELELFSREELVEIEKTIERLHNQLTKTRDRCDELEETLDDVEASLRNVKIVDEDEPDGTLWIDEPDQAVLLEKRYGTSRLVSVRDYWQV